MDANNYKQTFNLDKSLNEHGNLWKKHANCEGWIYWLLNNKTRLPKLWFTNSHNRSTQTRCLCIAAFRLFCQHRSTYIFLWLETSLHFHQWIIYSVGLCNWALCPHLWWSNAFDVFLRLKASESHYWDKCIYGRSIAGPPQPWNLFTSSKQKKQNHQHLDIWNLILSVCLLIEPK